MKKDHNMALTILLIFPMSSLVYKEDFPVRFVHTLSQEKRYA